MPWPCSKASHIFDVDKVIDDLKETDSKIALQEQVYQDKIDAILSEVRLGLKKRPKSTLLSLLRRKRMITKRAAALVKQREVLFSKILNLESMKLTNSHVKILKSTISAVRFLAKDLSLEEVELLRDDFEEMNESMREVNDVITEDTGLLADSNDEIEDELLALENELAMEGAPDLPEVPVHPIRPHKYDKEVIKQNLQAGKASEEPQKPESGKKMETSANEASSSQVLLQ